MYGHEFRTATALLVGKPGDQSRDRMTAGNPLGLAAPHDLLREVRRYALVGQASLKDTTLVQYQRALSRVERLFGSVEAAVRDGHPMNRVTHSAVAAYLRARCTEFLEEISGLSEADAWLPETQAQLAALVPLLRAMPVYGQVTSERGRANVQNRERKKTAGSPQGPVLGHENGLSLRAGSLSTQTRSVIVAKIFANLALHYERCEQLSAGRLARYWAEWRKLQVSRANGESFAPSPEAASFVFANDVAAELRRYALKHEVDFQALDAETRVTLMLRSYCRKLEDIRTRIADMPVDEVRLKNFMREVLAERRTRSDGLTASDAEAEARARLDSNVMERLFREESPLLQSLHRIVFPLEKRGPFSMRPSRTPVIDLGIFQDPPRAAAGRKTQERSREPLDREIVRSVRDHLIRSGEWDNAPILPPSLADRKIRQLLDTLEAAPYRRHAAEQPHLPPLKRRARGSRHQVAASLASDEGALDRFFKSSAPRDRDALAVFLLYGIRPAEMERDGVAVTGVSEDETHLIKLEVRGVKVRPTAEPYAPAQGQVWRSATFFVDTPWAEWLLDRCQELGGRYVVTVPSSRLLGRRVRRLSLSLGMAAPITLYTLRHEASARLKLAWDNCIKEKLHEMMEDGADEAAIAETVQDLLRHRAIEIARFLGHASDRTGGRYGRSRFASGRTSLKDAVSSDEVRISSNRKLFGIAADAIAAAAAGRGMDQTFGPAP